MMVLEMPVQGKSEIFFFQRYSFIETNPIMAVENVGNVVPIGSVSCDNKER